MSPEILQAEIAHPTENKPILQKIRRGSGKLALGLALSIGIGGTMSAINEVINPIEVSAEAEIQGPYEFTNSTIVDNAIKEVGNTYSTGWGQPGECMVAAQRWAIAANGNKNFFNYNGGVISVWTGSGGVEVPLDKLKPGDILQRASTGGDWDTNWDRVHTVVFRGYNTDSTVKIVHSNWDAPGKVTTNDNFNLPTNTGWGWRAFRFGKVDSTPVGPGQGGGMYKGTDTIGSYDSGRSIFYLKDNLSPGNPNVFLQFGAANWIPVKGDWDGNGTDTIGVVDPATQTFHLRNSNTGGSADAGVVQFGGGGWEPLVGNWDGIGADGIGSYDPNTSIFYLKDVIAPGAPNVYFQFGARGWKPLVGDWNGDGKDGIGVFDPNKAIFYLKDGTTGGDPNVVLQFGARGWKPVVGDWDGNGTDTVGVVDPVSQTFYLRNSNTGGPADAAVVQFGGGGWAPIVGDWNGR